GQARARPPRQAGALSERRHGQSGLDLHHPRESRIVSGHRGRTRLYRLERRAFLCSGLGERGEALGIQRGRRGLGFTGDCEWTHCDWRSEWGALFLRLINWKMVFFSPFFCSPNPEQENWTGKYALQVRSDHREGFFPSEDVSNVNSSIISVSRFNVSSFPPEDNSNERSLMVSSLPILLAQSRALSPL